MSPLVPLNCSLPAARVHAPLTLSDTWTLPATAYWANQPTSRSPAFTGLLSFTATEEGEPFWLNAAPCTNDAPADAPDAAVPDNSATSIAANRAVKVSKAREPRKRRRRLGCCPEAVDTMEDTRPPQGLLPRPCTRGSK